MSYETLSIKSPKPAVIECLLAPGENRGSVKSRYLDMVSTRKPPQAGPPSQQTTPLKEIATYPDTDENENRLYEVIRCECKSFQPCASKSEECREYYSDPASKAKAPASLAHATSRIR